MTTLTTRQLRIWSGCVNAVQSIAFESERIGYLDECRDYNIGTNATDDEIREVWELSPRQISNLKVLTP